MTPLTRDEFDRLVDDQSGLTRLLNELEYRLYLLGEPTDDRVSGCRDAAGALITRLRDTLFHWDQSILPRLDPTAGRQEGGAWP